jgi:sec-independent protein translocase protein TatA
MGLDNPIHIALVLVVLLLVFGAKRLPEMGRSLGSGLRGFKDSLSVEPERTQVESKAAVAAIASHPEPEHPTAPPAA